ncbi:hypothetical protein SAMN02745866_01051 [Alteromonadaceae bacterium Bs31]|nr:hypothetical protein SAMN02745866_01051 [Alteromonadaceae bacterium Bs31]
MNLKHLLVNKGLLLSVACTLLLGTAVQSWAGSFFFSEGKRCHSTPKQLINATLVLQIEAMESDNPELYPGKGAIVQFYQNRHSYSTASYTGAAAIEGKAAYTYRRLARTRALETAQDEHTGQAYSTRYTFENASRGTWVRVYEDHNTTLSGRFSLSSAETTGVAPGTHAGKTVVLSVLSASSDYLPEGQFPTPGSAIFQHYAADGSYQGIGHGPGTVDHNGTYSAIKIAPNTVLEETQQTIPSINYTASYTMVYNYDTPYSGSWYQSFADGLIKFSGTFTVFETQ